MEIRTKAAGIRSLDKFRAALKEFYKEKVEVQQFIDTKFKNRTSINRDMIEIAEAVNKL